MWVLRPERDIPVSDFTPLRVTALLLLAWVSGVWSTERNGWLDKIQLIFAKDGETLTLECHVSEETGLYCWWLRAVGVQSPSARVITHSTNHEQVHESRSWLQNLLKGRKHLMRRNREMLPQGVVSSPSCFREHFSHTEFLLGALEHPSLSGKLMDGIRPRVVLQHSQCYFHHQRNLLMDINLRAGSFSSTLFSRQAKTQ